jgi:hypothetical protein
VGLRTTRPAGSGNRASAAIQSNWCAADICAGTGTDALRGDADWGFHSLANGGDAGGGPDCAGPIG